MVKHGKSPAEIIEDWKNLACTVKMLHNDDVDKPRYVSILEQYGVR